MTITSGTQTRLAKLATAKGMALFIVLVGLGVLASIRRDYDQNIAEAFQQLDNQAILAEAKVSGVLRGLDIALRSLAADQESEVRLPEKAVSQHQLSFLKNFPEVRTITTTDASGQVIAAESIQTPADLAAIRAFNISGRNYFQFHRAAGPADFDRMHLSRPLVGSSKRWIIVASRAIRDEQGQFRGAVVATVIPRFFEPILLDALANKPNDAAAVHNRDGDILFRLPDPETHIGKNIAGSETFRRYLATDATTIHHLGVALTDNTERLIVLRKVGNTGLDVAISARFDRVIAKWYPLAAGKILLYGVFTAGAIALYRQWHRRRQAALALSQSEARFRHLFGHAPIALFIANRDGRLLLLNRTFEDLFGYRLDEVPTVEAFRERAYADVAVRKQQEQHWRDSWRDSADATHRPAPMEITVTSKGGAQKTVLLSRQRLDDDMLVAAIDITARKVAEEKVRELSQAIEQSPEAIVITDLDANIQYVNDAFVASSGYSRDELIGQNPRLLNSGKTPPETYEALWANLTRGLTWSGELINRRKNGSEYTELVTISSMRDSNGRMTHYVGVKQDITENKKLTEELDRHRHRLQELVDERTRELEIAKSKAETANIAKSAFLANMSHEIRTPMNGVLGMAHLLRRSGVTEKQAGYLDKIEASGNHLIAVINDILDLSKIEAGKLQLDEADFALTDLIRDVTDIVGQSAMDKGLGLDIDIAHAPTPLHGDRGRLRQALVNYLSNAVKFTETGRITLRCTTLEERRADFLLRFEVEDTGAGIEQEDLERLFQSFEQADNSPTRKHGGTGLGLAITKHLAELMGGTAGATSEPGRGSVFWMTARIARQASPASYPREIS